jgi:hypothetical protein
LNVTVKLTVVPTIAGFGETAGLESHPVEWPVAVPTAKAMSNSAAGDATMKLARSRPRRRTATSVMWGRMGRQGGVGNGTAVMAPRTLASRRAAGERPAAVVRPVARHPKHPLPHPVDHARKGPVRWAQGLGVPWCGASDHHPGGTVTGRTSSWDLGQSPPRGARPGVSDRTWEPAALRPGTSGPDRAPIGPTLRLDRSAKLSQRQLQLRSQDPVRSASYAGPPRALPSTTKAAS